MILIGLPLVWQVIQMFKKITIFCLISVVSIADDMGRLFTTPEQRYIIEENRKYTTIQKQELVTEQQGELSDNEQEIYLRGYIYRKNGKSTVWINDASTYTDNIEGIDINDIKVDGVEILLPNSDKTIDLKVGESIVQ